MITHTYPEMDSSDCQIERLKSQIAALASVLNDLKKQLTEAERKTISPDISTDNEASVKRKRDSDDAIHSGTPHVRPTHALDLPLPLDDYKRYGRQMILPQMGLKRQLKLKDARVLVIGLGGLGCPAAIYLAGAGVGTLGLMDGDTVELSNLHRQILHTTERLGWNKAKSAREGLRKYVTHR